MPVRPADPVHQLRADMEAMRAMRNAELQSLRESLAVNTALTNDIKTEVAELRADTRGVIDAVRTMEAGIRTIGRIGRVGERFGRVILFFVALSVVAKFVVGGASWSDVGAAMSRMLGR